MSPGESHSARREETEIDSRTSIICELSQQVSEQNERINKLEQKITDRDNIIQDLRHSSSSSLSPRVKSPRKPNYQESNSSGNSIKTSSVKSSSTRDTESNNGARPKSTEKYHSPQQRSSLAVQEEVDSTEQEMRELAREIKRMQRRKKKQRESEKDNRGSSGVSRDSGLGSATSINVDSDGKSKTSSQRQGQERTPSVAGSLSTLDETEGDGDMKSVVRRRIPSASYLSDSTLKDDDDDSVLGESDSRIPSNRTRPRGSDIAKVSDVNPYNYHEYDGSNHKVTNRKHGRKNSSAGKKRSNLSKEELCFSGTGDEADMSSIPLSMT